MLALWLSIRNTIIRVVWRIRLPPPWKLKYLWRYLIVFAAIGLFLLPQSKFSNEITYSDLDEFYHNYESKRIYDGILDTVHINCNASTIDLKMCQSLQDDPRVMSAYWVYLINNKNHLQLPFDWRQFLNMEHQSPTDCNEFFQSLGVQLSKKNITDHCYVSNNRLYLNPIDVPLSELSRNQYGTQYLLNAPIPERLIFLASDSSVVYPIYEGEVELPSSIDYLDQISIFKHNVKYLKVDNYGDTEPRRIKKTKVQRWLQKSQFLFNVNDFYKKLRNRISYNVLDAKLMNSLLYSSSLDTIIPKYFHEAKLSEKGGSHFDWRFFKKLHYSSVERLAILHRLARAWSNFSSSTGLETWIAHGNLLGWYWNGMNLPWDNDLDVQITMDSLLKLARGFNQSIIVDLNEKYGVGRYLVDVNTHIFRRGNDKYNSIDARFIDISSGFYIDITALTFTEDSKYISVSKKDSVEFNQLLDPDYVMKERSTTVLKSDLEKSLFKKRADLYNDQQIYNCKNNHFYKLEDLSPLIPSLFEGESTFVPQNYKAILNREYPKGLYYKYFHNHMFKPIYMLWVDKKQCYSETCQDNETILNFKHTKRLTNRHKRNLYYKMNDYSPISQIYRDPWILEKYKALKAIQESA